MGTFPCPCCGYLTFGEPAGSYEICPICYWEDDPVQLRRPERGGGANRPSLVEAQANFRSFGSCERCTVESCRAPGPDDVRDPTWRPVDLATDRFPGDGEYYWRRSG